MQVLEGLAVSPGVAIGRAVTVQTRVQDVYRFPLDEAAVEPEVERFHRAVETARGELETTTAEAKRRLGEDLAAIFEAHLLLLADAALLDRIEDRIRSEKVNAEWAVLKTGEELSTRFESLESPHFRERSEDLQDVTRFLMRCLLGLEHHEISEITGDVVIVAHDLTPSDAVRLGREHAVGFAVETGGSTSHTAIISRSLNIPLVAGIPGVSDLVTDEDPVIVDGSGGCVILHPTEARLAEYGALRLDLEEENRKLEETRFLEAVTRDGKRIDLMANVELPEELDDVVRLGADGIGLYRSEFLYIEKSPEMPSEEDHVEVYRRFLEAMAPRPVVIRTFDLGGRKLAREVMETHEDNPVLGLRGIRLTLARPEVFKTQIRALLRAGRYGNLWIMLPMISTVEEVRHFQRLISATMRDLEAEGRSFARDFKLGIMIEVPAAAMIADILAREVDFFSIGTNDLIQYSLAVDRNNEQVSYLYRPLHPAILRMIRSVVASAHDAGIDVAMCGEMAADPAHAAMLVGMGLRRLSVSPRMIPGVKARIREFSAGDLAKLSESCLELSTAGEVEDRLAGFLNAANPG